MIFIGLQKYLIFVILQSVHHVTVAALQAALPAALPAVLGPASLTASFTALRPASLPYFGLLDFRVLQ